MKVVQLYVWTPKHIFILTPSPKIAHLGPKKAESDPKIRLNSKGEIESYTNLKNGPSWLKEKLKTTQ